MAQDRTMDPVGLFANLIGDSLGDLNAEVQELRKFRDRIEEPKNALQTAEKQIVEREFAQAIDTLKPIVERMTERTDLRTLQRHAQQLWQLQRSFEAVLLDRQAATFESLAEVIELAGRALLSELPERFHSYPQDVRAKIKERQLRDLDVLLLAPNTFTERATWLKRMWPKDPGVESAIESKLTEAVEAAKGLVEDTKAKRFPGSVTEWDLLVARAKRLSGAIEHLVQVGFVSSDTVRLSEDELAKLEERAKEMGMLDALVCQGGLTEDERSTVLQLATKLGLTLTTTGLSVAYELKALNQRIEERNRKTQAETRDKRIKRIADELSRTRVQTLEGRIEAALQELEDLAPDDPVRNWLQSALDEAMPEIEASLAEAERLYSELLQPQSLLTSIGERVNAAQEAYRKTNNLLSEFEKRWPQAGIELKIQRVEQPSWSEYWAGRTRKLQSHLPAERQADSLAEVVLMEHFVPLLDECLEHGSDDSLDDRLRKAKKFLPEAWMAMTVRLFDVQAASQRIARALLSHSEEQKDVLAAAWLAMLGVAATPGSEYESVVAEKALNAIGKKRVNEAVEMIFENVRRTLEQRMDTGDADLQMQIIGLREVSRQERNAYLEAIRQLLRVELSKTTNDVKLRWPLLIALRHVPAGMILGNTDLVQQIRQTILDIGRTYALEEGPESVFAELMCFESQILLENMSRKEGGLQ